MNRYLLTRIAEADLNRIDEYVAERFGNAIAERVTERLFETFELLASQPRIGHTRPHWTSEEVLFFVVSGTPALVTYRDTTPLEIVRVWNGRQDPRKLSTTGE